MHTFAWLQSHHDIGLRAWRWRLHRRALVVHLAGHLTGCEEQHCRGARIVAIHGTGSCLVKADISFGLIANAAIALHTIAWLQSHHDIGFSLEEKEETVHNDD